MTARRRQRNVALRALIEEAGWTNHSFASAVNRVGAEAGVALHYDRTTVSHWLAGSRPRPPVRGFIAEALSRRLGRPVLVADAGLGDTSAAAPPHPDEDGASALLLLAKADLDPTRQSDLRRQPYQLDWTVMFGPPASRDGSPVPAGHGQLDAIRMMTTAFATAFGLFGGGHARSALTAYLAVDLPTWLYTRTAMRRAVLGEAAVLTHLDGLMCLDSLHHSLAQRYFQVARRLAVEAGDPTAHATVLRSMSAQACFLGHHQYAISMAEHAVAQAGAATSPATRAALLGQAAVAHGAVAHRRAAMSCLHEAEKCLDGAATASANGELADLADHTGRVLTDLGDLAGAETALRDSLRLRPGTGRRSRMLTTHRLAEVQLRRGQLDAACASWQRFLTDYPAVSSARLEAAVAAMRRRLLPYSRNPIVRATLRQVGHNTADLPETEAHQQMWPDGIATARADQDECLASSEAG
ncbi:tetratricopeptide repeat protein [Actinophytocola glycyrrhizae]|uniref:Tol-pal system YbgF family protein n=1 Tax=Actinophytocola glycyrrhizae TaxID=2044873 RepID=A0ABV9SAI0_9PSEU